MGAPRTLSMGPQSLLEVICKLKLISLRSSKRCSHGHCRSHREAGDGPSPQLAFLPGQLRTGLGTGNIHDLNKLISRGISENTNRQKLQFYFQMVENEVTSYVVAIRELRPQG